MPPHPQPYTRVLLYGIPFWRDAEGTLYAYESAAQPTPETRLRLGSEATGLDPNWSAAFAPRLAAYRAATQSRSRAPAAAPAKQN
jgi:hypothetical protein